MFKVLLTCVVLSLNPVGVSANPMQETKENDFLDLVDGQGNILIQGQGVDDVNAKAKAQGLRFPALGYWSPEGHCFIKPVQGDCNGVFKR
tara:strand:- start:6 stop:275 length:270 start_codon:yes stop_codon:yes gene_type:complete